MDRTRKVRFWRGPIVRVDQAQKIISVTGWIFAGLGGLVLLGSIAMGAMSNARDGDGALISAVLFGAPAAFLLTCRSRAAAWLLLIVSLLSAVLTLTFAVSIFRTEEAISLGVGAVGLFWTLLALLCQRAVMAASKLRRLKGADPSRVAEVFS